MNAGHDDLDAWTRQRTFTLAFELADSGRYENFADIGYALQFERALPAARALFDDPELRRELNRRCVDAREAFAPPEPAPLPEAQTQTQARTQAQAEAVESVAPAFDAESTPSFLRHAAAVLWRSGARALKAKPGKPVNPGDLNSAAS